MVYSCAHARARTHGFFEKVKMAVGGYHYYLVTKISRSPKTQYGAPIRGD